MKAGDFPQLIKGLPEADIPVEGVRGWISQASDHQIVFFEIEPVGEVPPHSHGAQWGIVVEGEMELTIDGDTRRYASGDSYFIPEGAVHGARFLTRCRVIDVFADRERWKAR